MLDDPRAPIFTRYSPRRTQVSVQRIGRARGPWAMDVVLHVGAHRTASTTFQKTLGANGAALAAAGVVYWGPKCTRSGLLDGLIGRPDATTRGLALARVARRARAVERSGARLLLVSEENALGSMRDAMTGGGFYADAGMRVAMLAEAFDAYRVTIALAIRAQDAWWRSVDGFFAARFGTTRRRPALVDRLTAQGRDWRDVISDVAKRSASARVVVWPHEALGHRPEAVFARLGGGAVPIRPLQGRKNASDGGGPLSPVTARHLRQRYGADLDWLRAGADGLAEFIDAGPEQTFPAGTGEERGRPDDGKFQDHQRMA